MKVFLVLVIICIIGISAFLLLSHQPQQTSKNNPQVYQTYVSPTVIPKSSLIAFSDPSLPISWQAETIATENYQGKAISGKELRGNLSYKSGYLRSLANTAYLQQNNWIEDINLAADGPNGSRWGYTKSSAKAGLPAGRQVVIFSYTNLSFTPPPTGTTCPCEFTVKIFLGDL
ncbi:MAG TPA: hypothetical protein VLG12_06130 [Candidatus Saccharimonadales bacterium]|nr:hypothetical protein [Candidatus Saccharimonadales bacterium]